MSKKTQYFGYVLLISGTVLFGIMHLAIAIYMPDRTYTIEPPSAFKTVLNEIYGWIPYVLSIVFMVLGMFFSFYDFINKSLQKTVKEIKNEGGRKQKIKEENKDV